MRFRLRNKRAPRDQAGARREALGRMRFSRGARRVEGDRFQCLLRLDPAPLYFFGFRGIRPARAGKLWGG